MTDRRQTPRGGPVLFELDDERAEAPPVTEAPPVPDALPDAPTGAPDGRAMQLAARLAARRPSRLARWFWGLAAAVLTAFLSLAAWEVITDLVARVPVLGYAVAGLVAAFVLAALLVVLKEVAAIGRLARIDDLRQEADAALAGADLEAARRVVARLDRFYAGREETRWGRQRLAERQGEIFDAPALLELAEDELMAPLDRAAAREVQAAARQVAAVTALVPLALADVVAALTANLRMIRAIAQIYGGRAGTLGSWRLARAVLTQLVATGAVAAGDDLIEPLLGGSVLSKVSRRFGEGLVNGALVARVGVAAMEVCRPLPFSRGRAPSVRRIVRDALSGLFGKE